MKNWKYPKGIVIVINENATKGMRFTIGLFGLVVEHLETSIYDYEVKLEDGSHGKFKEEELDYFFKTGDVMKVVHNGEKGKVVTYDLKHKHAELQHGDGSFKVYTFSQVKLYKDNSTKINEIREKLKNAKAEGKFERIGHEIGKFTDDKNIQYGSSVDATYEMMKVLMERYRYDDGHYLMPEELLSHILLQVRIMDKQNRIFNRPSGKGDKESPYKDITGYGIIGVDMVERRKQNESN